MFGENCNNLTPHIQTYSNTTVKAVELQPIFPVCLYSSKKTKLNDEIFVSKPKITALV